MTKDIVETTHFQLQKKKNGLYLVVYDAFLGEDMMKMMIFKIYEICRRRMMNLRRKFLTRCTQNPHNEQFSKQGRIIRPQYGRSMVEMLGVLAIVGVLSVGSISGYSKAMMKYKMNKFSVAMNELLNTSMQYTGKLDSASNYVDEEGAQYLAGILHKMNAVPDGITYINARNFEDMFGNQVWPYIHHSISGLGYQLSESGNSDLSSEICQQLFKIAKENASQLFYISAGGVKFYGNADCLADEKCLTSIKLSDVDTACHSCVKDKQCKFYFFWK